MKTIETLLALAAEFPTIKRIDYDNDAHREFCNKVLLAVKDAVPTMKQLSEQPVVIKRRPGRKPRNQQPTV